MWSGVRLGRGAWGQGGAWLGKEGDGILPLDRRRVLCSAGVHDEGGAEGVSKADR